MAFAKKDPKACSDSKDVLIEKLIKENRQLKNDTLELKKRIRTSTTEEDQARIDLLVSDRVLSKVTSIAAFHKRSATFFQKMFVEFERHQKDLDDIKKACIAAGAIKISKACDVVNSRLLLPQFHPYLEALCEDEVFDSFMERPEDCEEYGDLGANRTYVKEASHPPDEADDSIENRKVAQITVRSGRIKKDSLDPRIRDIPLNFEDSTDDTQLNGSDATLVLPRKTNPNTVSEVTTVTRSASDTVSQRTETTNIDPISSAIKSVSGSLEPMDRDSFSDDVDATSVPTEMTTHSLDTVSGFVESTCETLDSVIKTTEGTSFTSEISSMESNFDASDDTLTKATELSSQVSDTVNQRLEQSVTGSTLQRYVDDENIELSSKSQESVVGDHDATRDDTETVFVKRHSSRKSNRGSVQKPLEQIHTGSASQSFPSVNREAASENLAPASQSQESTLSTAKPSKTNTKTASSQQRNNRLRLGTPDNVCDPISASSADRPKRKAAPLGSLKEKSLNTKMRRE
ncbi:unnamed protein product [Bursaphelenchus okinawaensis]|uniref:Uncharacterized protein n=1 Tax=Bursaphelenchus okinawaensis TaxID=465554 RepID=A0A811KR77_9BILA|nr:unnamed protein product [Bursaphelenchus okinawaensis]CAG9112279.1 unnamed protein product [Bursaphelenchus okinawaensis]